MDTNNLNLSQKAMLAKVRKLEGKIDHNMI